MPLEIYELNENEVEKQNCDIAYQYKLFTFSIFPYKNPKTHFKIINTKFSTIELSSSGETGLPYGAIPRILTIWLITQAVKNKNRKIFLPNILSSFIKDMDLSRSGGKRGDITRLKNQFYRLLTTSIRIKTIKKDHLKEITKFNNIFFVSEACLWWNKSNNTDTYLEFSEEFFNEISNNVIPIDINIIKSINDSCLALDLYSWMVYRFSYLKNPLFLSWATLKEQFGTEYNNNRHSLTNFKIKFLAQLEKVLKYYDKAKIYKSKDDKGIILMPSPTSVSKRNGEVIKIEDFRDKNKNESLELYLEEVSREYKINIKSLHIACANKTIHQIRNSIKSVKEFCIKNKVSNLKACIIESIKKGWNPSSKNIKITKKSFPKDLEYSLYGESVLKEAKIIWEKIMKEFISKYGISTYENWLYKAKLSRFDNLKIVLLMDTNFMKKWFETYYLEFIEDSIRTLTKKKYSVTILLNQEIKL